MRGQGIQVEGGPGGKVSLRPLVNPLGGQQPLSGGRCQALARLPARNGCPMRGVTERLHMSVRRLVKRLLDPPAREG